MTDNIEIIAYETKDSRAGPDIRWIAVIIEKGAAWPIYTLGRSEDAVIAKLSPVIADARAKRKRRIERDAARTKRRG